MVGTRWLVAAIAAAWMGAASAQGGAGGGAGGAGTGGAGTGGAGGTGAGAGGGAPESEARAGAAEAQAKEQALPGDAATTLPKLHAGNKAEIQAGQWMQQHGTNSKVKGFGKRMVKDHGAMDKDLQAYAQKHGVALTGSEADALAAKHQQALDELKGMKGADADRHYMQMMVEDHTNDVNEVKAAVEQAKQGSDKAYTKLLQSSEKKMESHLKEAQKISREIGPQHAAR